jgi:uncharacterized protein YuzE
MKIEYSKDIDALYINIEEGVTIDLDAKRHVVGIEILDASEKMELSSLVNISIENIPLEKVS